MHVKMTEVLAAKKMVQTHTQQQHKQQSEKQNFINDLHRKYMQMHCQHICYTGKKKTKCEKRGGK